MRVACSERGTAVFCLCIYGCVFVRYSRARSLDVLDIIVYVHTFVHNHQMNILSRLLRTRGGSKDVWQMDG